MPAANICIDCAIKDREGVTIVSQPQMGKCARCGVIVYTCRRVTVAETPAP